MAELGWIGLGIMGSRMAVHLRRAGHELTVWNRTHATAEAWASEHGARVADSPAEVARACEVLFTMVVDGAQVESVLLDADRGALAGASEGLLCVDCSTIAPTQTRAIGAALAERGVRMLDAPVTGSAPKAKDGTLTIMAGGAGADYERALPLLETMGELVLHAGPLGHGEAIKLINNAVAAANAVTIGEALRAGRQAGLDLDALVEVMGAGSGGSTMLSLKAGPMREGDYTPLFKLEHMLKDVRLCLAESDEARAAFPSVRHAEGVLEAAAARGFGQQDFAALVEALDEPEEDKSR
ncbi:MAG: NAD(P)-dependent oxidoreductase [Solirubrobacteraceae bacterium]